MDCMPTQIAFPLLELRLFRIRTFSAAVSGSFFTRLGIGGVPFLLPLLYQVGLASRRSNQGCLIMPQAIAAMSTKFLMPKILDRVGYRAGADLQHGHSRPAPDAVRHRRARHAGLGNRAAGVLLWRLHLAAIYQHEYPGLCRYAEAKTSSASSIASTMQQMSISFGVAAAGLTTAFFLPDRSVQIPAEMIHGLHLGLSGAWRIYNLIRGPIPQIEKR